MNRMRKAISALALAIAVTAAGGGITIWGGEGHAVVADRCCC